MTTQLFECAAVSPAVIPRSAGATRMSVAAETLAGKFRARPLVVLSAHFDDACFSLGGFLARTGQGDLVNIFTQGTYLARGAVAVQQEVFALRDAEDAAFAAHCGLKRHDLGCEEPSLRARRPSQLKYVEDDIAQITGPVLRKLDKLADGFAPGARGVLFAPLGVGRHVNHRAVASLIQRYVNSLLQRYDVFFYEDLPYAANPLSRLLAFGRVPFWMRLEARHVFPTDPAEKKKIIGFYPSQLKRGPESLSCRPAALSPFGPHEAFWSVSTDFHAMGQ